MKLCIFGNQFQYMKEKTILKAFLMECYCFQDIYTIAILAMNCKVVTSSKEN